MVYTLLQPMLLSRRLCGVKLQIYRPLQFFLRIGHTRAATGESLQFAQPRLGDARGLQCGSKHGKLTTSHSDQPGKRTLDGANYGDLSGMNATSCIRYCQSKNFVYAGTEYSSGETLL